MTKTSALMGSPLYMSPEQMQSSKNVDARGDIWALGVILYELVTGIVPFSGESMPEVILQIMSASPPPIRNQRPDAPDGLEAVIFKCLEKDRGKRYETVGELAVALLPFAPKRSKASVERISGVMRVAGFSGSALALPPSSAGQEGPVAGAGTAASWGRTTTGKSRGPWLIVGGLGALIAVGATVISLHKPSASDTTASGSASTNATNSSLTANNALPVQTAPATSVARLAEPIQDPGIPVVPVTTPTAADGPAPGTGTRKGPQSKAGPVTKRPSLSAPTITPVVAPPVTPPPVVASPPPVAAAPSPPPKPSKPTGEWGSGRL